MLDLVVKALDAHADRLLERISSMEQRAMTALEHLQAAVAKIEAAQLVAIGVIQSIPTLIRNANGDAQQLENLAADLEAKANELQTAAAAAPKVPVDPPVTTEPVETDPVESVTEPAAPAANPVDPAQV